MKKVLSLSVVTILGILLNLRVGSVHAQVNTKEAITSPITKPITSQISYFLVSGRILNFDRLQLRNVHVAAKHLKDNRVYKTPVNEDGTFSLLLPKGKYIVKVGDTEGTRFVPGSRTISVNKNIENIIFNVPAAQE